ncbi:branched-chain-amino-acid aminotransferase 5, chloroplastic [Cryptomeria japonica]|uniref:branched-chain-amino-acid aminotransferase 5, chloroplastic n=1 Tax=Cryptomeria japonica TaxID=3369 RepID=UPI0027D9FB83|nr:branched-chain-amino-acid aminotransferase 5, chloroplastic [Cryptomeria japonica]
MESVSIRLCSLPANDAVIVPRSFFASSCPFRKAGLSGSAGRSLSWNGSGITLRFNTGDNKFVREHCNPPSHILGALHTQAEAAAVSTTEEVDELADIDWDGLGFGIKQTDYMYIMKCGKDGIFFEGDLTPFGTIELSPSAGVLNYGQGLFEGLKAYRRADRRIVLFRPEENALRMINGAERLCMPAPSVEQFVEAVKQTVLANKRWIPPPGKGSLYIRPLLMGSGPVLGLAPAPEVTFLIYVSPVGNYFKEGLAPIHLKVETKHHRATPGGTGGIKTIGNYAPVLSIQSSAKANGFSDVVYLDAINKKYLEEVSSCNIFVVKDNVISTPALHGTILPGITRKSIIEVARSRGYEVQERLISVDELLDANEVFCTGTAVVVSPVGSITYFDNRVVYKNGSSGGVSRELYSALTGIQMGLSEDSMGWTMELN